MIKFSRADLSHVRGIFEIISYFQEKSLLLERSYEKIERDIENFIVALDGDVVIGCVSLFIYNRSLSEVRSLAIKEDYHRKGIGAKLVKEQIKEAKRLKIDRLFALTLEVDFFKKLNFLEINKSALPEKIWLDCNNCSVKDNCQEVALVLDIKS